MTTAGLLFITTTLNVSNEKSEKEENRVMKNLRSIVAEHALQLRETPSTKEHALAIMREWINQNTDIRNIRQGKSFGLKRST